MHNEFFFVQVARTCNIGENLFDRLGKSQTLSRQILRNAVPWMVSRLGPRFPSTSMRDVLYPIVQEVVVERRIAGIQDHAEYNSLRKAGVDAEFALLQKIQETTQKNTKALRDKVRELVVQFWKEDTDSDKVNWVKY